MKKRAILLFWFLCLLPFAAGAQDGRQRTVETVVADVLAQLPAGQTADYRTLMDELAATGTEGIRILAGMLVPAGQGSDAAVEYALSGVVHHVTEQESGEARDAVRQGLAQSIDTCPDPADRAFLISLLACCSTAEDAAVFAKYAEDGQLADAAVRGLIATPGSEPAILELMQQSDGPSARLAHAAAKRPSEGAEEILLAWLADYPTDDTTREAIYAALAACGGRTSLRVLGDAAAAADFDFAPGDATGAFLDLLNNLAERGDTKVVQRAARALAKESVRTNIRTAALKLLLRTSPEQRTELLLAALGDNDRAYRCAALTLAADYTDEALCAAIVGEWPKLTAEARTDVVNWLGDRHAASQTATVLAAIDASDPGLAAAAVRAAGRLGGQEALEALIGRLNGPLAEEAVAALASFNGQVDDGLVAALDADPVTQANALRLVARRRITRAADRVFALLDAPDAAVSEAAYRALASIAAPADVDRLSRLLDTADAAHAGQLSAALTHAVRTLAPEKQYETVYARMSASPRPERYYPTLAQTGTQQAIDCLVENFAGSRRAEAFDALLRVDAPQIAGVLYTIAAGNPDLADRALTRYTACVAALDATPVRKYQLYRQALELNPSPKIAVGILRKLEGIREFPALVLAGRYLDDEATAHAAAAAVKTIAAKSARPLGGDTVRALLEKSRDIYREWAKSDADAGYAVDELTLMLSKLPAEGFAAVATDLAQWSAVTADPARRATMKAAALKRAEAAAAKAMQQSWTTADGTIAYAGGEPSTIAAPGTYENFEFWIDCRTRGAAGIAVRSTNRIGLGGDAGSGALTGNRTHASTPAVDADNADGEWNTLHVKIVDDRVTVEVNGRTVTENVILENTCAPGEAAYASGAIELLGEGDAAEFRDFYLCELPATPVFELSPEERAEGYEVLFDGRSLHKWTGNTTNYVPQEGTIYVTASYGGKGNLYTVEEYGDFILRFEFRFLREGVNNGIGLRTPMGVDAAYHGMEIQILDHDAPIYKNLRVYQQHGSVYGIIPAKRIKFGELGTWNVEEIRAVGDRITVTVNGEVILDGDIREACQGHNVSEDGSKKNPYTVDHRNHPGLFNKKGHIGLLGHGAGIQFRNIRIKSLDAKTQNGK